jgi:DHA1 family tetracycline resistance protein-like MFS transporter
VTDEVQLTRPVVVAAAVTRASRRPALAFVLVTVTLDMLALGMIVPVLPGLVVSFSGGDTAEGARMLGLFGTAWALMQFVFSPILGALSDRFGRRPVILCSNLGLGLDYVLMALAPSLSWLFVGRAMSGLTAASISTAGAYISDVSPPEKRASGFGLLGAAFGVGFILGPAIGGLLATLGPRVAFWVAAGFSLVNAAYGFFVLPESLSKDRRSAFSWRRANPLGSLALLRSHRELWGLSVMSGLGHLAHGAYPAVFVLYAGYRYGWGEHTVGLTLAAVGLCSVLVQGGLVISSGPDERGESTPKSGRRRGCYAHLPRGSNSLPTMLFRRQQRQTSRHISTISNPTRFS